MLSNRSSIVIALLVCAAFAYDIGLRDAEASIFLGRQLLDLLHWVKFWE